MFSHYLLIQCYTAIEPHLPVGSYSGLFGKAAMSFTDPSKLTNAPLHWYRFSVQCRLQCPHLHIKQNFYLIWAEMCMHCFLAGTVQLELVVCPSLVTEYRSRWKYQKCILKY